MVAFREAIGRAKRVYFDENYGEEQLYLGMLACHPDYQKRGAGEMLCRWGLDKGKADGLNLTLFASPMGSRLYRRLGFEEIGSFRTQVVGEDEFLDIPGMVLEAKKIR
jgi:ribosomal protein S18 acetylase RimI-like enzyme